MKQKYFFLRNSILLLSAISIIAIGSISHTAWMAGPTGNNPPLFIPKDLTGLKGTTVTVPVMLSGSSLGDFSISGVDLAIAYDSTKFSAVSNITVGSLLGGGWQLSTNTATLGVIRATFSKATGPVFSASTMGPVLTFDLTIDANALNGASAINLLQNYGTTTTQISDNDINELMLIPAPTNADADEADGVFIITGEDVTSPLISTVVPADNATSVSPATDLVITFNEVIGKTGVGTVSIKKLSDNSVVQTILVTSDLVTGSGSASITIHPGASFAQSTAYSVLISPNAFPDTSGNYFAGISDDSLWNFTTSSPPVVIENDDGGDGGDNNGEGGGGGGGGGNEGISGNSNSGKQNIPLEKKDAKDQTLLSEHILCIPLDTEVQLPESNTKLIVTVGNKDLVYHDVPVSEWFALPVFAIMQTGIASGYRDEENNLLGLFKPANSVTYAEISKMALEIAKEDATAITYEAKNPTSRGQWSAQYIALAEYLGLSAFLSLPDVNSPASRGAVIQTILEAVKSPILSGHTNPYIDLSDTHPNADAILTATNIGVMTGDKNTSYEQNRRTVRPNDPVNRAEVAAILSRVGKRGCERYTNSKSK